MLSPGRGAEQPPSPGRGGTAAGVCTQQRRGSLFLQQRQRVPWEGPWSHLPFQPKFLVQHCHLLPLIPDLKETGYYRAVCLVRWSQIWARMWHPTSQTLQKLQPRHILCPFSPSLLSWHVARSRLCNGRGAEQAEHLQTRQYKKRRGALSVLFQLNPSESSCINLLVTTLNWRFIQMYNERPRRAHFKWLSCQSNTK